METTLKTFYESVLNPQIFDRADVIFPELKLETTNSPGVRWRGTLKWSDLTQGGHVRPDRTIISYKHPFRLYQNGKDSRHTDFAGYIMAREGVGFPEAIRELAKRAGVQVPQKYSPEQLERWRKQQEELEAILDQTRRDLWAEGRDSAVLRYLTEVRGYPEEEIKEYEIGELTEATAKRLKDAFDISRPKDNPIWLDIWKKYPLVIPANSCGQVRGCVFRAIAPEVKPKYRNAFVSDADTKRYYPFGLCGFKVNIKAANATDSLLIVEGELDALRARHAGIRHAVAASSSDISEETIRKAKERGFKAVTILFDTDQTEEARESHLKAAEKVIKTITEAGLTPYVASFGDIPLGEKCDTDEYLKTHTKEQFKELVSMAEPAALFMAGRVMGRALKVAEEKGGFDYIALEAGKEGIFDICKQPYCKPTHRDMVMGQLSALATNDTGEPLISKESLLKEFTEARSAELAARKSSEAANVTAAAFGMVKKGNTEEAIAYLRAKLPQIEMLSDEAEFSALIVPDTRIGRLDRWRESGEGITTGYGFCRRGTTRFAELLKIPAGALTFICSPTSHGKSRFLENLAVMFARLGKGKVYYFSFEESSTAVEQQLLNIYANTALAKNNLRAIRKFYRTGSREDFISGTDADGFLARADEFHALLDKGGLRVIDKQFDSNSLRRAVRYIARQDEVEAVFIDYIQIIHSKAAYKDKKQELRDICEDLREVAKETGLPIVLAAQLNRQTTLPVKMTPGNISDAVDIEQSADVVVLIWNSAKPVTEGKDDPEMKALKENWGFEPGKEGKMYCLIAKNRSGLSNLEAVLEFDQNTGVIKENTKFHA